MTTPGMTPSEAADVATFWIEDTPAHVRRVFGVLIDHARATSPAPEGGDLADPTGAHARMRERIAEAVDRVWSPGDDDEDDERGRLLDAVMGPVSALMERGKHLHQVDAGIIRRLRSRAPAPSVATPPQKLTTIPTPGEIASAARIVIEHSGRYPTDHPMAHALAIMQQLAEPSVPLAPDGGDLAAVLDRLLTVADDLMRETTDPGTEALAAVWCARQALIRTTAPSVATPPQRQPENFDRTPGVGCAARDGGEHWPGAGRDWRECIDCDEWPYAAAPPAEGEAAGVGPRVGRS